MRLSIQRIADIAALERLAPEWDEIDGLSSPRTPFTSPWWNLLWWRHFSENGLLIRDELFVLAVRDEQRRLVALAPMMRTLRPGFGPVRMREIQFFGNDTDIMELRGLACRTEYRAAALQAIHEHLMQLTGEWDSLLWCGIPAGESVGNLGAQPPYRTVRDYYLQLPASWPELLAGLSRNMKEALRKCYNSLKREGHAFTFRAVGAPAAIDAALERFFQLHRARSRLGNTVPHPDRFNAVRSRKFFREYAHHMAQRDQLRIFQLEIGGCVVASRIAFLLGEEMYLYYSGYLPEWRRFSVMTTLTTECIKWAIERRLQIVNLSTGHDYSKVRWRPAESAARDYLVWSPLAGSTPSGRLFGLLRHAPPQSMLGRAVAMARRGQ
jgi:CelD/BcsL family acetyltransferase involved in cellulose biosynthesis